MGDYSMNLAQAHLTLALDGSTMPLSASSVSPKSINQFVYCKHMENTANKTIVL